MGNKSRTIILFAAVLIIFLCGIIWALLGSHESQPYYDGKRLDYWLEGYGHPYYVPKKDDPFNVVMQKIGTNALPSLLRMASAHDPALVKKSKLFINSLPRCHIRTDAELHKMATTGFVALGHAAKPAVPDLIALLSHKDADVRRTAVCALALIGPGAEPSIPALIKCVDDSDQYVRLFSVQALGEIGKRPDLVVPVLIDQLAESHRATEQYSAAMSALADFKDYPLTKTSVPRIIQLLNDTGYYIRSVATNALDHIDPDVAAKAGIK